MLDAQAVTANARGNASALRGLGFLPRDTYIHRPRNILLMREWCWESGMAMNHQLRSKGITAGITIPLGLFEDVEGGPRISDSGFPSPLVFTLNEILSSCGVRNMHIHDFRVI